MKYKLEDLIDLAQFQALQDRLHEIYTFPSSIIDNDGNILTATGWQDICTLFHRKHHDCEKECIKSDKYIISHIHEANPYVSYQCPHGLVDNAIPIIIDGMHYANFFTGQFFLEEPDFDYFCKQAEKFGFNQDDYLAAVKKVPIWTREQLEAYLRYINNLIGVLSDIGLKKLREIEARERISQSEEKYRNLVEVIAQPIFTISSYGIFTFMNTTAAAQLGGEPTDFVGKRMDDLFPTELAAQHMSEIYRAISSGKLVETTQESIVNGQRRTYEARIQPIMDDTDTNQSVLVILKEITEQKQAEEALHKTNERLQLALQGGQLGIWDENFITGEAVYDPGWANMLGYTVDELEPTIETWKKLVHPDDLAKLWFSPEEAIGGQQPNVFSEFRMKTKSGEWKWIYSRGLVVEKSPEGNPIRAIGIHQDITAQKMAEEALRESEEKFRDTASLLPEGIYECDVDGNLIFVNEHAFTLFGYSREDFEGGLSISQMVAPEDLERAQYNIHNLIQGKAVSQQEYTAIRKDGHTFPVLIYASPMIKDEKIVGLRGIIVDISERKKAEEIALHSQKMAGIGNLAAGMAHEINSPLQLVTGISERLEKKINNGSFDADEFLVDLSRIKSSGWRISKIIKSMLTYARQAPSDMSSHDLNELVEQALILVEHQLMSWANISIHQSLKSNMPKIHCDGNNLIQVLLNLIQNASDAMPNGGEIKITTEYDPEQKHFILQVSDTGPGIAPEIQEKIFEPFFTTKDVNKGTGLGLSIVHGIIEAHGGTISVESEPGCGSTFSILLPETPGKHRQEGNDSQVPGRYQ